MSIVKILIKLKFIDFFEYIVFEMIYVAPKTDFQTSSIW